MCGSSDRVTVRCFVRLNAGHGATLYPLFKGGQATSCTANPSDWVLRGWFSDTASPSFYWLPRSVHATVTNNFKLSGAWHNISLLPIHAVCPVSVGNGALLCSSQSPRPRLMYVLPWKVSPSQHPLIRVCQVTLWLWEVTCVTSALS